MRRYLIILTLFVWSLPAVVMLAVEGLMHQTRTEGMPQAMPVEFAFVRDGAVVAVPVALPVTGVVLATQQPVFSLWAADDALLNACGYYPVSRFDRGTLQSNETVTARAWVIEPPLVVERVEIGHAVRKLVLSRVKLAEAAKQMGWAEAMMAFIHGDPVIAVRWYSAERLVAGSEELEPFLAGFAAAVGATVEELWPLLEMCQEERVRR